MIGQSLANAIAMNLDESHTIRTYIPSEYMTWYNLTRSRPKYTALNLQETNIWLEQTQISGVFTAREEGTSRGVLPRRSDTILRLRLLKTPNTVARFHLPVIWIIGTYMAMKKHFVQK